MSTGDNSSPFLVNRFATGTSRLSRTGGNKNNNAGGGQGGQTPNQKSGKNSNEGKFDDLMPHKVSEISENVLFQDMDCLSKGSPKKYQRNKKTQGRPQPPKVQMSEQQAMGAINNVFMGATTKYNKMTINTNLITPKKMQEEIKTPKNSETSSQHSGIGRKFNRRKTNQPQNETNIEPIDLSLNSTTPRGKDPGTDRSNTDGKRIERKSERSRHLFKHGDKNKNQQPEVEKDSPVSKPGPSKMSQQTPSNITQNVFEPEVQRVQNRYSRPVQRQNQSSNISKVVEKQQVTKQQASVSTINQSRPYPNRQTPLRSPVVESTPQAAKKEQEEVKPQPSTIQRKPYPNRNRMSSEQEEQSSKKVSPEKKQQIKQPEKKPISRAPGRYGANKVQQTVEKTQEEEVKPTPKPPGRYGANKVQQTVEKTQQKETKPISRAPGRYGANRVQQTVDKTQEEEVKPTPRPPGRYGTKVQETTEKVQEDEVKPTPRPPGRYGANKVQQTIEKTQEEEVKLTPKPPGRYGANKVQQAVDKTTQKDTKPISRAPGMYGANRVQQTVDKTQEEEVKPTPKPPGRYGANKVQQTVEKTTEEEVKPTPKPPGRYGAKAQETPVKTPLQDEIKNDAKPVQKAAQNRYGVKKSQPESPMIEKQPEQKVDNKPAPRLSNRYGAKPVESPAQEKQEPKPSIENKPIPRSYGNRYGANKVEQKQETAKQVEEEVKNESKPPSRTFGNRYGANKVQQTQQEKANKIQEKVPEAKPLPVAPRSRVSSTKAQPQNTQKIHTQTSEMTQPQKPKAFQQKANQNKKQAEKEVSSPGSKAVPNQSRNQSQAASLAGSKIEEKIVLKKSGVIGLVFKRLLFNQVSNTFNVLKNTGKTIKVRHTLEASLLASACSEIVKRKDKNLVQIGFDQLRKQLVSSYIPSIKPLLTAKVGDPTQTGLNILHQITLSKTRDAFKALNNKLIVSNKMKAVGNLQMLIKAKQKVNYKRGLACISNAAKDKVYILGELTKIVSKYNKEQLYKGFAKLLKMKKEDETTNQKPLQRSAVKPKVLPVVKQQTVEEETKPNPALLEKSSKLASMNTSLSANISKLENRVEDFKREKRQVNDEFSQRIKILKEQNEEIDIELTQKKNRNEEVTRSLAGLSGKTERKIVEEDLEPKSKKLQLLTNIYIGNFKLQQSIYTADIQADYEVDPKQTNLVLNEWSLLLQNTQLKKEIALYEQTEITASKARKTLMNEQQAILKLVKSYIKEQYFWQWLHVSVEGM